MGSTNGASKTIRYLKIKWYFVGLSNGSLCAGLHTRFFTFQRVVKAQENSRLEPLKGTIGAHQMGRNDDLDSPISQRKTVAGSPSSEPFRLFQLHGTYMALFES
ncbi:hypothetical protein THH46_13300 [Pseudomonas sp. NA13]